MNLVYLDQFISSKIRRPPTSETKAFQELFEILKTLADSRVAIFPFSDNHIAESNKISDLDHRRWLSDFWDRVGSGFRYFPEETLRTSQLQDIFLERPIRFAPHLGVYRAEMPFLDFLNFYDGNHGERAAHGMKEVVAFWKTNSREELRGQIRKLESSAPWKMSTEMFQRIGQGKFPEMKEIRSLHNALLTKVFWLIHDKNGVDPTTEEVLDWLSRNLEKIPSLYLEACCLEARAEDYCAESTFKIENSALDHDAHDFEAFSNYMPYSAMGIFDKRAIPIFTTACVKAKISMPRVADATPRTMAALLSKLKALPSPEPPATLASENCPSRRTLLFLPIERHRNFLIQRENLSSLGTINRQILPHGGVKVWSENAPWHELLPSLKATVAEFPRETHWPATVFTISFGRILGEEMFDFGIWELNEGMVERITALP